RSDYAVLDYLKTLPVRPFAMAAAAVAAPALASFALQALPLAGFALVTAKVPMPLNYVALLLPADVIWLAIDNAMFLRSPYAVQTQGQADPTMIGREILVTLIRVLFFLVAAGLAVGSYLLTYELSESPTISWSAAWTAVIVCAAASVL